MSVNIFEAKLINILNLLNVVMYHNVEPDQCLPGSAVSWNLVETLRFNLMTVIIIGVCGVMFVVSLIVAVIVISHRVMAPPSAPDPEGKESPAAHHLLYDHVTISISGPHLTSIL